MDHKPNLNVKANDVKVFEESIGEIFLAVTKKYKWKTFFDKLYFKLKTSAFQKILSRKWKEIHKMWENICKSHI